MSGSVSAGQVTFNVYPSATNRVPGIYYEVDASGANTGQVNQRSIIVAQMLSTGTATANIPVISTGVGDAKTLFGKGSMMARMVAAYRAADTVGELWCLPVVDESGGVQASSKIVILGTATAAGTLSLYVAGTLIPVAVAVGDTPSIIDNSIVAAVNAMPDLPCTSALLDGANPQAGATFVAKHKGVIAGDLDVRINLFGAAAGEVLPAGITSAVVTSGIVAGTTDPTATHLTAALANLADMSFDFIVWPYSASAQLASIEAFLNDVSGRWSFVSELYGMAWSAFRGSYSACVTYGLSNNNQHVTVLPYFDSPTCVYEVAADYCATCAVSVRADPALPLQNISLSTMIAPPIASRFPFSERNTLLFSGLSTFRVNQGNVVVLERATTTYQLNAEGGADDSYLDVETGYTLQYLMRNLRSILQSKFARVKLVADGTRVPFGANFVTAQTVGGEVIAWYRRMATLALVQNPDQFAAQLVAQNAGNGQVSILAPFQLANQLRAIALRVDFSKP